MNKGRWKNHATTVRYAEELLKGGAEGVVVIKRAALRELVQCAKRGLYADKAA